MKGIRFYANLQRGQAVVGSYCRADSGDTDDSSLASRGRIAGFTPSSRKRLRRYLRNSEAEYRVFGTLTYPADYGRDLHSVKRDLEAFIRRVRRYVSRETFSLCWFLEFQGNGRAHIHFYCTDFLPKDWLSRSWYEIVGSADPRHLAAGTNIKSLANREQSTRYALKYASKAEQKVAPDDSEWIGRFWGVRGVKSVVEASTTFSEREKEDPEIAENLESMRKLQKYEVSQGKMVRKELEIEGKNGHVVLYLWPIDREAIRMALLPFILRIADEVKSNESRTHVRTKPGTRSAAQNRS